MSPADTKDAIAAAFWALVEQKDVDKITVSDLAKACSITRQAFYYHFQSIDDMLKYAVGRYSEHMADQVIAMHGDPIAAITLVFSDAINRPDTVLRLVNSKKYSFDRLLFETMMEQVSRIFLELRITRDLSFDATEMAVRFYTGALFANILGASQAKLLQKQVDTSRMAEQYYRLFRGELLPPNA